MKIIHKKTTGMRENHGIKNINTFLKVADDPKIFPRRQSSLDIHSQQ